MNSLLDDFKQVKVSTLHKPNKIILSKKKNNIHYNSQINSKKKKIIVGCENNKYNKYKQIRIKERKLLRQKKKQKKYNSIKKKKNKNKSKKILFNIKNNKVKKYICSTLNTNLPQFNGYESDDESELPYKLQIREMPDIDINDLFI